jgi:uncharacterized protein YbjT (DUF2867 family)
VKILVNSGNIGTPVAIQLASEGHEVRLGVRSIASNNEWDRLKIRQVPFDINNTKSMEAALKGAEAFFSLTPLVQNMVEAGVNAMRAAKSAGVKKIVRSSAAGAGPHAKIELGRWHYEVEKAAEESGIPFTILRPMNFMQNFLMFGNPESIKSQNAFYAPLGNAKLAVVDTRDVSRIAAKCLTQSSHDGKCYELTGRVALSNQEMAKIFSEVLGRTVTYIDVPETAATEGMAKSGMPGWLIKMLSELNAIGKAGYLSSVSQDAERILGQKPTAFRSFVQDHISFFEASGAQRH